MKNLDFQTACLIYLASNVCIAALLAVAFTDSRARGSRLWLAGLVAQIIAAPLFALRGAIPDVVSIVAANGLFALSWSLYWASFDVFFGNRRSQWFYGLPLLLVAGIYAAFLHDVKPRAVLATTLFAVQAWAIAATVLARRGEFCTQIIGVLGAGYIFAGLASVVRGVAMAVSPDTAPDPFAPSLVQDVALLLSVPSHVACTLGFVLLHRERVEREVRHLADIDFLTGLQNRRGFESMFARELRDAAASGVWTSLALIDIDYFKTVNDTHGHGVGDKALVALARILAREVRGNDGVARIGGDEFCVLLSHTNPDRAARVAERLRRAVSAHPWDTLGLFAPLTVSIGLASHQGDRRDDASDFLRLADMALLEAKNKARDMVLHADQLARGPLRADA
ncbi:MAG: GGDEF domain-containing protein [Solidesulfovibrio sp.]